MTEKGLRVKAFADATGYKESTVRKKLQRREISFWKINRIILIPESEVTRLFGDFRPAIGLTDRD